MTDQTSPQPSNFCRDCAHLIGKRDYKADAATWTCGAPQNMLASSDLVTGQTYHKFLSCYKARENAPDTCGLAGLWFVEYKKPDYSNKPGLPSNVDSLLDELEKP